MILANSKSEDYFHKPIFILGLPRSGTSMVAGILNICGAWMGKTVPGGGVENPKGFFENVYLREAVNKKILANSGSDPLGVQTLPYFDELPSTNGLEQNILGLLEHEGYDFLRPWAFKEPKLTLIWPCFAEVFPNAHWLIVRRPTEHIVKSCLNTSFMKRQSEDPAFWHQWAEAYLLRLDALKLSTNNWSEIWSQPLIDGDLSAIKPLVREYSLAWQEDKVRSFITPEYWHFQAS